MCALSASPSWHPGHQYQVPVSQADPHWELAHPTQPPASPPPSSVNNPVQLESTPFFQVAWERGS